jgi:DNA-directed RNA polymerase subunit beta'
VNLGATITVKDGEKVAAKKVITRWDPHSRPIIARENGTLVVRGPADSLEFSTNETMQNTRIKVKKGAKQKVVMELKVIQNGKENIQKFNLPSETLLDPSGVFALDKSYFAKSDNARDIIEIEVQVGDILAKIPQEVQVKNRDITGGLPRVAALFEARKPKRSAVLAEAEGFVRIGRETNAIALLRFIQWNVRVLQRMTKKLLNGPRNMLRLQSPVVQHCAWVKWYIKMIIAQPMRKL